MPPYRTLMVAPPSDLAMAANEVQQVVNILGAKLLQGDDADIHGILNMVATPFDIVWFAAHGSAEGVYLKDGILNTSEITTLVRSSGAQLVVMNTCSSRNVALGIYDELKIPLVCTIAEVPDRTAFITGTIFARKIAEGMEFREAYEAAKPGQNRRYTFLPEEGRVMAPPPERSNRIEDDITSLAALVRRLEILVTGNADYNVEGLTITVRTLSKKVDQLLVDFGIMKSNQMFNRRVLIFLAFLSVSLLIAVAVLVYQRVTL
jgi:hypothetical protein